MKDDSKPWGQWTQGDMVVQCRLKCPGFFLSHWGLAPTRARHGVKFWSLRYFLTKGSLRSQLSQPRHHSQASVRPERASLGYSKSLQAVGVLSGCFCDCRDWEGQCGCPYVGKKSL